MNELYVHGCCLATDKDGYLLDRHQWSEAVCLTMAEQDRCQINDEHWKIIYFLRDYYEEFNHSPAMRILIKALREVIDPDKANSQYLYELFPYGPAKQATRYAGLPKPAHCI